MNNYERAYEYIERCGSLTPCCCCYGPTGPTGPTGPAASIDTLLVSNDGRIATVANANLNLGVLVNSTGDSITFTSPDTISLEEAGTYIIQFTATAVNTEATGDIGASLNVNGTIVPAASLYESTQTNPLTIVLNYSLTITTNTNITVSNNSTVSNTYHDASIQITKVA